MAVEHSMLITVNGKEQQFDALGSAADLLRALGIERERVALMLNETVIRRAKLEETPVADGDVIEIITMVGGG
jgi:sulfur carrier protein